MRYGAGIFLILIGAIAAFAVRDMVPNVDLRMIGYICMGVGALALVLAFVSQTQATNTSNTQVIERRDDAS